MTKRDQHGGQSALGKMKSESDHGDGTDGHGNSAINNAGAGLGNSSTGNTAFGGP